MGAFSRRLKSLLSPEADLAKLSGSAGWRATRNRCKVQAII